MKQRWFCVVMALIIVAVCTSCGKKQNIFSQQTFPVIVSYELEVKDTVHIKSNITYQDNGMPASSTSEVRGLYDETLPVQRTVGSFSYDPKERRIGTANVYQYEQDGDIAPQNQYYWFDAQGRLLKTENVHETDTLTYDDQGHLTGWTSPTMETVMSNPDGGIKTNERHATQSDYTFRGVIERNDREDFTFIEEIGDYPSVDFHFETRGWFSYDDKGRLVSQSVEGTQKETMAFTYEGDSFDVRSIDIQNGDGTQRHIEFNYQYEGNQLKEMTIMEDGQTSKESYSYDEKGRLIKLELTSDVVHEVFEFQHKQVKDPVIASFLKMKTTQITNANDDCSYFVLQADENDLYHDHFCYQCGRLLPFPVQTCFYCGAKVNSTTYNQYQGSMMNFLCMWNIWTLDGNILH